MSDASVITDVSETLRSILDAHLNPAPGEPGGVGAPVTVTVDNPQRAAGEDLRVNLYLYHILQDESRRNSGPRLPIERTDKTVKLIKEPLALKLYYMVTAFAPDGRTEHRLIGETIQALYSHRILDESVLVGDLKVSPIKADKLQLVMLNQDLETLHRIWGNFQEALRPSVTYEVEGLYLDAALEERVTRLVETRELGIVAVPYLSDVAPRAVRPGATIRIYGANLDLRAPGQGAGLVKILVNGAPVVPIPDRRTSGAVSIAIPSTTPPGSLTIQAQIGDFTSRAISVEVLPP